MRGPLLAVGCAIGSADFSLWIFNFARSKIHRLKQAAYSKPNARPRLDLLGARFAHWPPAGWRLRRNTFAGAAVPVPVSVERPTRVLAGGTQFRPPPDSPEPISLWNCSARYTSYATTTAAEPNIATLAAISSHFIANLIFLLYFLSALSGTGRSEQSKSSTEPRRRRAASLLLPSPHL